MAVKEELKKLQLHFMVVDLGEVEIMENISMEQRQLLKAALLNSGLELMDDKKSMLIEKIKNVIIEMVHHSTENIKINFAHNDLKNIIINILSTMVEFAKKYSLERVIVNISLQMEENSDEIDLKIEDNIKDIRKKEFFEQFLNFEDENKFDSKIYLAKLLADKNQAIFLCNILEDSTSYYIKFKKAKVL